MKEVLAEAKKKIPTKLNECIEPDGVSKNLWKWVKAFENLGKILLYCIIIIGVISTISDSVSAYQIGSIISDDAATLSAFFSALKTGGIFSVVALVEYLIYNAIVLGISALASLVQNTNISTNLAIYNAKSKYGEFTQEKKPKHKKEESEPEISLDDENWNDVVCPHCNQQISFPESSKPDVCPWCKKSI